MFGRAVLPPFVLAVTLLVLVSGALGADPNWPFWTSPRHRTIALFVDFRGAGAATRDAGASSARNLLFQTVDNGGKNNVVDFYRDMSYGRLTVTMDVAVDLGARQKWIRLPKSATSSRYDGANNALPSDAILAADRLVDFRKYDSVVVVVNKEAWPVSGTSATDQIKCGYFRGQRQKFAVRTADGATITRAAVVCEDSKLKTFVHEFGHILGHRDHYGGDPKKRYLGGWDIMDGGVGFSCDPKTTPLTQLRGLGGWSRMKLGFIPAGDIATVGAGVIKTFRLDPVTAPSLKPDSKRLIRIDHPLDPRRYLVLEARQNTGYDANLPGTGVLLTDSNNAEGKDYGLGTVQIVSVTGEKRSSTAMERAHLKAPAEPPDRVCGNLRAAAQPSTFTKTYEGVVQPLGNVSWKLVITVRSKTAGAVPTYAVTVATERVKKR